MRSFSLFLVVTAVTLLPATVINAAPTLPNNPNPPEGKVSVSPELEPVISGEVSGGTPLVTSEIPVEISGENLNARGVPQANLPLESEECSPLRTNILSQNSSQNCPSNFIQLSQLTTPTTTPTTTPAATSATTSPLTTGIPGLNPPDFLNPGANPLLFPTISEEVRVNITEPITLEQAIILARRNNPLVRRGQLTIDTARSGLQAAYAAEYPTGTATFTFQRSRAAQPSFNSSANTSANAVIELDYNLYSGGRRPATIASEEAQLRNAQLALEVLLVQLRLDVANDYYGLQQADSQLRITQSSVIQAQTSLRDAQLREQAGVGTQFEVLQADVALANARQNERNAVARQLIARRQIAQRLNLPQTATIVAADEIKPLGEWQLSLEDSIVLAFKNRAELEQQLVAIEQSEAQQRIAVASTLPQVNLFANYNVVGNLEDGLNTAGGGSIGIRATWTFFDGGAARARVNQRENDIAAAQSTFTTQRNQIRFAVEQDYYNLQSSRDNIATAAQAVTRATEGLRLARLRFQAGVGTQSEVITAQTDLTTAELNQLNAIVSFNQSLASLQRNVSNLDGQLFDRP